MRGWMQQEHARASSLLLRKILAHQAPPPCHRATCCQREATLRRDLDGRPPPVWRWDAHGFASRQQDEAIWSSRSEAEGGKPRRGSAFKGTGARFQGQWSASMDQVTNPNAGVIYHCGHAICTSNAHGHAIYILKIPCPSTLRGTVKRMRGGEGGGKDKLFLFFLNSIAFQLFLNASPANNLDTFKVIPWTIFSQYITNTPTKQPAHSLRFLKIISNWDQIVSYKFHLRLLNILLYHSGDSQWFLL